MSECEGSSETSGKKLIPHNYTTQLQTLRKDFGVFPLPFAFFTLVSCAQLLLMNVLKFAAKKDTSLEQKEKRRELRALLQRHTDSLIRDLVRIEARVRQERRRILRKTTPIVDRTKNEKVKREIEDFIERVRVQQSPKSL